MKKTFLALVLLTATTVAFSQTDSVAAGKMFPDTASDPGLPVLRTYVPPDVVARAVKKFGRKLYCIAEVKHPDGTANYRIGLLRNGRVEMEWLDEKLKMV